MQELLLRPTGLHWRELDGEIIALDAEGSKYMATNPAGTLLWEALSSGSSRARLEEILTQTYGLSSERAAADTDAFLVQLEAQGLLRS